MWGVNRKANTLWKQAVISGIEPVIVIDWHKGAGSVLLAKEGLFV